MNWSDVLEYRDGNLYWKSGLRKGKKAGAPGTYGYIYLSVNGKRYSGHRIIWEMHNGEIPKGIWIDHKDRNTSNNKIENLRLATPSQNHINRASKHKNRCVPRLKNGKYRAHITVNRKKYALGNYFTEAEAIQAYNEAALKYHGEFAMLNELPKIIPKTPRIRSNKIKTHCNSGHEFTDENTTRSINKDGSNRRRCRACARIIFHRRKVLEKYRSE